MQPQRRTPRRHARTLFPAALLAASVTLLAACGSPAQEEPAGERSSATASAGQSPAEETPASKAPKGGNAQASRDLLAAAAQGEPDAAREALKAGADVEARDDRGRTPLILAATGDHDVVARILVDAGADPDAQDEQQDSAWLVTGVTGSVKMARVLIPAKPDYTLENRYGGTSLIPAGEHGHAEYIREVLKNTDMDVDHVNNLGWTALLEAIILGDGGEDHRKTVQYLLDGGADPKLADSNGVAPLQHAEDKGQDEIAALLRAADA